MNNLALIWSANRYKELESQLVGYWAEDIWDLKHCPLNEGEFRGRVRYLKFLCPSKTINNELKYAFQQKFIKKEWSINGSKHYPHLLTWFNFHFSSSAISLAQLPVSDWSNQYLSYINKLGIKTTRQVKVLTKNYQQTTKIRESEHFTFLREIYKIIVEFYDVRPELEKDIWKLNKLGISTTPIKHCDTLNFTGISQLWLRNIIKKYLFYCLSTHAISSATSTLSYLTTFSTYLFQQHPNINASQIDRSIIIGYLAYLPTKKSSSATKAAAIINLKLLIETSLREEWADFPLKRIIFNEDLPKFSRPIPRLIPDNILQQLFHHLIDIKIHYQRMVYILYEVGMRMRELVTLPYDCLRQDSEGSWWIKLYQSKMKKEHIQPISNKTAYIIQAQQEDVAQKWGDKAIFLFPNPRGNHYNGTSFRRALNILAIEKNICDSSGKIWRFEPHQFRHNFATRLINNGLAHHFVQRLLGHKSPEMTSHYARIYDKTLKDEYEKALSNRKLVDVSGRVINEENQADAIELQWLKKHVDARTLPNGYCGIPIALAPCPHPNACLTCPHFRTDQTYLEVHQKQLEETVRLVQISKEKGWQVQINNNEKIITNLGKIINSLKDTEHDSST